MPVEDCRSVIKGQKPPVTTKQLKNHGIIFKEATTTVDHLEAWLQPIYHSLMRIPDQFPRRSHKVFGKELQEFKRAGQDRQHDDVKRWCLAPEEGSVHLDESFNDEAERSQVREHHKESQDVAMAVRSFIDTGENEPKWHRFLENRIFLDFETARKGSDKYEQKLEGWEVHSEVLFNGIPQLGTGTSKNEQIRHPKPDLTYGFPIIQPSDEAFQILQGDRNVDSFSLPTLGDLRVRADVGLLSTPTAALTKWTKKKGQAKLEAKDLMCFPWAIVEVKRAPLLSAEEPEKSRDHDKRTRSCYCQAANASAAALRLREDLAIKANNEAEPGAAQVIFAFTCVGSTAKLWVTYRKRPKHASDKRPGLVIMRCIWTTSLGLSWGVIALRRIVSNVTKWVLTRSKPDIIQLIQRICSRSRQTVSLTPSGDTVNYRRRAVSLGPAHEDSESEESDAPMSRHEYRTPQGKERPNLPYGKTAPAALNKTSAHFKIPRITYNDLTQHDREDSSASSDEGYASTCISGGRSRSRVNSGDLCDFVLCEDTSEEDPDDSYVPTSSSDEDGDSDDGEDEDSEAISESEDDEISEEEVEDLLRAAEPVLRPESQEYYFELPDRSIHNSRVDVQLTPTKGSRRLSVLSERRSKKDKRGSARF